MKWVIVVIVCGAAALMALGSIESNNKTAGEKAGEACFWNLVGDVDQPGTVCMDLCARRFKDDYDEKRACMDSAFNERAKYRRTSGR